MHSLIGSSCQSEEVIRTKAEVLKQNLQILTNAHMIVKKKDGMHRNVHDITQNGW